jgi:hypothetical protein
MTNTERRGKAFRYALIQQHVTRQSEQQTFLEGVPAWDTGMFRESFSTPEELRGKVVGALHNCEDMVCKDLLTGK